MAILRGESSTNKIKTNNNKEFNRRVPRERREELERTLIIKKEYDLRREEENFLLLRAFYHQYTKTRKEIELGTLIIKKEYDLRR